MIHHDQSIAPVVAPLPSSVTRRGFLGCALATSAVGGLLASRGTAADEASTPAAAPSRVIKLGLIGCGGRGAWLGGLFKKHGGFEIHATADYDETQANAAGDALGVDKARRFSGLSAYRKLIASGCEAVTVVNIPRFHATHGLAAIEAGLHVYAAKPVAIDVPGALAVQAAGKLATAKKLVYLVDYQIPTDPIHIEVVKRIHEGGVGRLMHIDSQGFCGTWPDPENRSADHLLHCGQWITAIPLSGDFIVEYSVHTINALLWAVGKRPVKATGFTRRTRANAKGDGRDVYLVTYEFDDGLLWTHRCQALNNVEDSHIRTRIFGDTAHAEINYWGRSFLCGGGKTYDISGASKSYAGGGGGGSGVGGAGGTASAGGGAGASGSVTPVPAVAGAANTGGGGGGGAGGGGSNRGTAGGSGIVIVRYLTPVNDTFAAWAASQSPPVTGGPNGDDDNDGVENLIEYALADGQERGSLTGSTLTFTKRGAPWGGDITYSIETSDDLGISDPWQAATPDVNDASTISYTLPNPGDNFARLKVSQN